MVKKKVHFKELYVHVKSKYLECGKKYTPCEKLIPTFLEDDFKNYATSWLLK